MPGNVDNGDRRWGVVHKETRKVADHFPAKAEADAFWLALIHDHDVVEGYCPPGTQEFVENKLTRDR